MKKALLTKLMLLLCALIAGSSSVWATDVLYYTLTTASTGGNSTPHNSYTAAATPTIDGIQWSVMGNSNMSPWRLGGKAADSNTPLTTDRAVFSKTAMGSAITEVKLAVGAVSGVTVNSLKLIVSTAEDGGGTKIDEVSGTFAANSTISFKPTSPATQWATGSFYKFVFNITITATSNKYVEFSEAKFYAPEGTSTTVATPTISGKTPFYPSTEVTIECGTEGASIQYSLDNGSNWTAYSDPFTLTETKTVKAKATKSGSNDSEVASMTFTKGTVQTVADALTAINALADDGTIENQFVEGVVSTAAASVSSGKMNYSISDDGTKTSELAVYQGKGLNNVNFAAATDLVLGDKVTIFGTLQKYVKNSKTTPEFISGNYLVDYVAVPRFSVAAGAVASGTQVELSTPQDGFTIYYTADGSDPKTSGTEYTGVITISATTTIKAYAKKGTIFSNVATAEYTLATPAATPTFSPVAGAYNAAQNVTISTTTDGAEIYYTINGTDPTTSSTKYTGAISVNKNTTIKAIAVKDGLANSAVATAKYTFYVALPYTFDGNGTDAGSILGLTANSLANYDNSPKIQFNGTGDYLVIGINEAATLLSYDIKGNSFSGGTFKVQTSVDGETYNDLKEYTTVESTITHESLNNIPSTARYIKFIYTNKSGGNVGVGKIGINCEAVTVPASQYMTYCNATRALDFTDVTAYKVSAVGADYVTLEEITQAPANTPVILKATAGTYGLNVVASASEVTGNKLLVSDGTVTGGDGIYALASKGDPAVVGFYKVRSTVTIPAGKCYLDTNTSAPEFLGFDFNGETTGINTLNVERGTLNGEVYNLNGQRVAQPTKGLYIVNGKKVVIK